MKLTPRQRQTATAQVAKLEEELETLRDITAPDPADRFYDSILRAVENHLEVLKILLKEDDTGQI